MQVTNPLRTRFNELRIQAQRLAEDPSQAVLRRVVVFQLNDVGRRLEQWEKMNLNLPTAV